VTWKATRPASPDHHCSHSLRSDDPGDADTGLDGADIPDEVGIEGLERP